MYTTLEQFYKLFTYLTKYKFFENKFNDENKNDVLKILGKKEDFDSIINLTLKDYKRQYLKAVILNKKYADYCDPKKFEVLRDGRPNVFNNKFKVDFFEDKNDYDRNAHYLLCVLTDLYKIGLGGLEKTLNLVDSHLAIIRVQKEKLDQNQAQYESIELKKK